MKKLFLLTLVLVVLAGAFLAALLKLGAAQAAASPASIAGFPDGENILAASIQISIFHIPTKSPDGSRSIEVYERGLATMIQSGSQVLLISHDHWASLENIARVEFHNAHGKLLWKIEADEFLSLIRYRDEGTMLLGVPVQLHPQYQLLLAARRGQGYAEVLYPAIVGNAAAVQIGQIVTVAYRAGEQRNRIGLKQAVVTEIQVVRGRAAFQVKNLDGSPLLPGDSGGGVFVYGDLVGNLWMVDWEYVQRNLLLDALWPVTRRSDTSIAAHLPCVKDLASC